MKEDCLAGSMKFSSCGRKCTFYIALLCYSELNYFDGGGGGCIKGRENAFLSPGVFLEKFFSSPCVFAAGKTTHKEHFSMEKAMEGDEERAEISIQKIKVVRAVKGNVEFRRQGEGAIVKEKVM